MTSSEFQLALRRQFQPLLVAHGIVVGDDDAHAIVVWDEAFLGPHLV